MREECILRRLSVAVQATVASYHGWKGSRNSVRYGGNTAVSRRYCACITRRLTQLHTITRAATSVPGLYCGDYVVYLLSYGESDTRCTVWQSRGEGLACNTGRKLTMSARVSWRDHARLYEKTQYIAKSRPSRVIMRTFPPGYP